MGSGAAHPAAQPLLSMNSASLAARGKECAGTVDCDGNRLHLKRTDRKAWSDHSPQPRLRISASSPGGTAMGQDEVANAGRDLRAETRAVEDAIMADTLLQVIRLLLARQIGRELKRRERLTD